jgi:hypothetical protein
VQTLWEDAEHRLLVVQSELQVAKATQRAVTADLSFMEGQLAQSERETDAMKRAMDDARALQLDTEAALERARESERSEKLLCAEAQLQLGQALVTAKILTRDVQLGEQELAETTQDLRELNWPPWPPDPT